MADKKITELTAYTTPIDTDVLPIVDVITDTTKKISYSGLSSSSLYRQAIINGNFDVWQRGTSFLASGIYTADRWQTPASATEYTTSRQTAGLSGSTYCIRVQRDSGSTKTDTPNLVYTMESVDSKKFAGKDVTFSFWARVGANYAGSSFNLRVITGTGTDQNTYSGFTGTRYPIYVDSIAVTTTWQKFTYTSTLNADTNQIGFYMSETIPASTAGAADYFEIAQVQLNAGSVALPFQPKSYVEELRDCQRYCYGITSGAFDIIGQGSAASTTVAYPSVMLPVPMRSIPTLTATAGDWQLYDGVNAATDLTAITIDDIGMTNNRQVVLKATTASGLTQYRPYFMVNDATAGRVLILSAELY